MAIFNGIDEKYCYKEYFMLEDGTGLFTAMFHTEKEIGDIVVNCWDDQYKVVRIEDGQNSKVFYVEPVTQ